MDTIMNQEMIKDTDVNSEVTTSDLLSASLEEFKNIIDEGMNGDNTDVQRNAASLVETTVSSDVQGTDVKEKVQDIDVVEGWLSEINPKYNPFDADPSYENNCGCCAYAVSQRLDGKMDITAGPDNIGTNEGMEGITGHKIEKTTPEEIELSLIEQGEGAHAIVGIDRLFGPGHWFNAYCPDGKSVYYVDGQCNKISEWPPKNLGFVTNWVIEKKEVD